MKLTKILAGILLVLALSLAVLAWMMGRQAPRQVAPSAPAVTPAKSPSIDKVQSSSTIGYVVASQHIAAGARITEQDLQMKEHASALVGGFKDTQALIGKTTLVAIAPQQAIVEQHLVGGLSLQLESGQRAVSITVKEPMAAGNHVRPGDFVDVFFTMQSDDKQINVDTQTRLLLARSRVLAYGSNTVENPPKTIAQQQEEKKQDADAKNQRGSTREERRADIAQTAVLAVPVEDVQRLTLAEKFGQLNLALRHPDDEALPDPALFAALPLALQPVGFSSSKEQALSAVDTAYAGLKLKDLAQGSAKSQSVRNPSANTTHRALSGKAPRVMTANPASSIEIYNGSNVQTVSY